MLDFLDEAQDLFEYTQALRRDFHRHPELGFSEVRTAGIVAQKLTELGLEITTGVAETGVVGLLEGEHPGPVTLLRFDMDALPIVEQTGAEYASLNPGVMHACGHDGHTAIGLTVARLLHAHQNELAGTVKLVFQPAEEGLGGAIRMIEAGVLQNPKPDFSLALHLWNEKPFGWLGIASGPTMAAAEIFKMRVVGKGGHGAVPDKAVDPVVSAAQIISTLQSIVARNISPLQSAVISVTTIHGGDAFNVIPSSVELTGTIRTFEPSVRKKILERFHQVVASLADAYDCQVDIDVQSITSAVVNNPMVAEVVQSVAAELFPDNELDPHFSTMGSEDMSAIMEQVPGCYFFIGSANPEKGLVAAHHHPSFDFDERALPRAVALIASAAVRLLGQGGMNPDQ
jgi:amidohydrolase